MSPPTKKAKTETSPDINNLPPPTIKGWGKTEWMQWSKDESAKYDRLCKNDNLNWDDLHAYIEKRSEAVQSAAPEEITVKISIKEVVIIDGNNEAAAAAAVGTTSLDATKYNICSKNVSEIVLSKQGNDTFRSILDKYCQEQTIEREDYHWNHKEENHWSEGTLLNQTDVECFFQFWHPVPSTLVKRFADENTFLPEIVGRRKRSPGPKPTVAPSCEKLKSLPPDGNASREEWDKWHRDNSMGCHNFWREKNEAVEYNCPDQIDIVLKGLSHEHTVKVNAWGPLSVALNSYCASTAGTDFAVTPSEVILRTYGDPEVNLCGNPTNFVDAQTTSPRMRFNGYSPLKLEVVYRDTSRTHAEWESIQGTIPDSLKQFVGSGYRLSDTEYPWLVTQENGIDAYNKIGQEALRLYRGPEYEYVYEKGKSKWLYDPVKSWFGMTGKVKTILGTFVRKPRSGWSEKSASIALDRLTAALISLICNEEWSNDACGKILFANPDCRKEIVTILRKMDNCAVSVINAANEFTTASEASAQIRDDTGGLGLDRALAQLKRLMTKYEEEYSGFSKDGYGSRGYMAFSKALPLIN